MAKKEIMVLFVGSVLIILIGIGTFGFFFDVGITGKVVSIGVSENLPQGFDLAVLLIIIIIIILVIMNVVLKNLAIIGVKNKKTDLKWK